VLGFATKHSMLLRNLGAGPSCQVGFLKVLEAQAPVSTIVKASNECSQQPVCQYTVCTHKQTGDIVLSLNGVQLSGKGFDSAYAQSQLADAAAPRCVRFMRCVLQCMYSRTLRFGKVRRIHLQLS
jgi:hypothetical protein